MLQDDGGSLGVCPVRVQAGVWLWRYKNSHRYQKIVGRLTRTLVRNDVNNNGRDASAV